MKLISEEVGRSTSSMALLKLQTHETCGKRVTKPRRLNKSTDTARYLKDFICRQEVIDFRTLLMVKYVS